MLIKPLFNHRACQVCNQLIKLHRLEVFVIGRRNRKYFSELLGLDESKRWLLVAMGGMDFPLDFLRWPRRDDSIWLIPGRPPQGRDDLHSFDAAELRFGDLLASVDAVITKPGYGTFVEAACAGTPILYLKRDDWPETPYFAEWLGRQARATALGREAVLAGDFMDELQALRAQPAPPLPQADGAGQAARKLVEVFAVA